MDARDMNLALLCSQVQQIPKVEVYYFYRFVHTCLVNFDGKKTGGSLWEKYIKKQILGQ